MTTWFAEMQPSNLNAANFIEQLQGVLTKPPITAETCKSMITLPTQRPLFEATVEFLDEPACQANAPFMLFQVGFMFSDDREMKHFRELLSARLGTPCYSGLYPPQPTATMVPARLTARKDSTSLKVLVADEPDSAAALTVFATAVKPATAAGRLRYEEVRETLLQSAPAECR